MEAEAASRHVIGLNPDYAEAHNNLAVALEVQGRLDEALQSNARAIELNPDYTEAHINTGNLKLRRGDARAAIEAAPRVASLMAEEMGRDRSWRRDQVESFQALAAGYLP